MTPKSEETDTARVEVAPDQRAHLIFNRWDKRPDIPAYWCRLPSWVQDYATECVRAIEERHRLAQASPTGEVRGALIRIARMIPGVICADGVSDAFLASIPDELAHYRLEPSAASAGVRDAGREAVVAEVRRLAMHIVMRLRARRGGREWVADSLRDNIFAEVEREVEAALTARPDGGSCTAAPDYADIMETIANASDDWQKHSYTSALAEVRDMANVGRALMEALPKGYHYLNCPSEIVSDLQNEIADLTTATGGADREAEIARLREALDRVASKNDLSDVPDDQVEAVARSALYDCECIARTALDASAAKEAGK